MTAHKDDSESNLKKNEQGGATTDLNLFLSRRDALKLGAAMVAATGFGEARQAIVGSSLRLMVFPSSYPRKVT
jgi:hypothetical protein